MGRTPLSKQQVRDIHAMLEDGFSDTAVAEAAGCSRTTVGRIRREHFPDMRRRPVQEPTLESSPCGWFRGRLEQMIGPEGNAGEADEAVHILGGEVSMLLKSMAHEIAEKRRRLRESERWRKKRGLAR